MTWITVQASLSAITPATPSGSSRGMTGWTALPTPARIDPRIAATEPVRSSQYLVSVDI
jgi:hypothetical protein